MATPATVEISESNGAGEVVTDGIANINMGGADIVNLVPANHQLVNTTAGFLTTFFKALRFHVTNMGTSATLQGWRVWKSGGAYKVGEDMMFASLNSNTYHQPSATGINNAPIAAGVIPASDPLVANVYGGAINAAPDYTYYFYLQARINNGGATPNGALNQKTLVMEYDES